MILQPSGFQAGILLLILVIIWIRSIKVIAADNLNFKVNELPLTLCSHQISLFREIEYNLISTNYNS
jgi:hypothetical protein